MDIVTTMLTWAVDLGCIYLAYLAVREVESIARRSFSLLLTMVLVLAGSGLLINGITPITAWLLNQGFYSDFGNTWYELFGIALFIIALLLVMRGVTIRIQRGACPQCGTALLGHVACPNCGWGGLGLMQTLLGVGRQATPPAAMPPLQAPRAPAASYPAPPPPPNRASAAPQAAGAGIAPTVLGAPPRGSAAEIVPTVLSAPPQPAASSPGPAPRPPAAPAPAPSQPARFCADCGAPLTGGQERCARCGAVTV